jgi:hypothetical protein
MILELPGLLLFWAHVAFCLFTAHSPVDGTSRECRFDCWLLRNNLVGSKLPHFVLLVAFTFLCPCCLLPSHRLLAWLCMVHIKYTTHPISNRVLPEPKNMAYEEVAEVLLEHGRVPQMQTHHRVAVTLWPILATTTKAGLRTLMTASESDSLKRVKVAAATTATGINFDFGASNVGKACVEAMETHAWYFLKGHSRSPGVETVPTPRATEALVFEDLLSCKNLGFNCTN